MRFSSRESVLLERIQQLSCTYLRELLTVWQQCLRLQALWASAEYTAVLCCSCRTIRCVPGQWAASMHVCSHANQTSCTACSMHC